MDHQADVVEDLKKRYILPHTKAEIERMQNQHEWVKACAKGLIKAPLDRSQRGLRILDSATADGFWIKDVAWDLPNDTEFIGFDIAPDLFPPPSELPPNASMREQNLIQAFPQEWLSSFDLVHQRFVISLFKESEANIVLGNLLSCVKPGGWIQFCEPDFGTPVSEPPNKTTAFQMIHKLTGQVMADNMAATKLEERLEKAGFVNVEAEIVDMIAGNAHPDPEIGERGFRNLLSILDYFQSVTTPSTFGMTEDAWRRLPGEFAQNMREHRTAVRHYFVWGQKPPA